MSKRRLLCFTLAMAVASPLVACSTAGGRADATAPAASPKQAIAEAALVLDVRTADEFASGHLPEAVNIPVDEVEARVEEIAAKVGGDRTKPIAIYCASGNRAGKAESMLEKAGFTKVTNAGGYASLKG
jgi:phage shock protein E